MRLIDGRAPVTVSRGNASDTTMAPINAAQPPRAHGKYTTKADAVTAYPLVSHAGSTSPNAQEVASIEHGTQ